jgi:hypothetical protein
MLHISQLCCILDVVNVNGCCGIVVVSELLGLL